MTFCFSLKRALIDDALEKKKRDRFGLPRSGLVFSPARDTSWTETSPKTRGGFACAFRNRKSQRFWSLCFGADSTCEPNDRWVDGRSSVKKNIKSKGRQGRRVLFPSRETPPLFISSPFHTYSRPTPHHNPKTTKMTHHPSSWGGDSTSPPQPHSFFRSRFVCARIRSETNHTKRRDPKSWACRPGCGFRWRVWPEFWSSRG